MLEQLAENMKSEVVIIGGGPAALEAALTARSFSTDITIVAQNEFGDWSKPGVSNILLERLTKARQAENVGSIGDWETYIHFVKSQLKRWHADMEKLLRKHGIRLIRGQAKFRGNHELYVTRVENKTLGNEGIHETPLTQVSEGEQGKEQERGGAFVLSFKQAFVAVGSTPVFPPELSPDRVQIFSPHTIPFLRKLPKSILVIGDGPISIEYASIFQDLGVEVTWLTSESGPNLMLGAELHQFVTTQLIKRGMNVVRGPFVNKIKKQNGIGVQAVREDGSVYESEVAFLSIGFRSNVDQLEIENTSIARGANGWLKLNEVGQTNVPGIYVVGDARFANSSSLSMKQARMAVKHAFGQQIQDSVLAYTPVTFHQNPQISLVGLIEADGESTFSATWQMEFRHFKAYMSPQEEGLLKVIWNKEGQLLGAVGIGEGAAEVLTPLALAMQWGKCVSELADCFAPHPALSELAMLICREIETDYLLKSTHKNDK